MEKNEGSCLNTKKVNVVLMKNCRHQTEIVLMGKKLQKQASF